jgi:hypothetical protein
MVYAVHVDRAKCGFCFRVSQREVRSATLGDLKDFNVVLSQKGPGQKPGPSDFFGASQGEMGTAAKRRKKPSAARRNQSTEVRQTARTWQKDGGRNIKKDIFLTPFF